MRNFVHIELENGSVTLSSHGENRCLIGISVPSMSIDVHVTDADLKHLADELTKFCLAI